MSLRTQSQFCRMQSDMPVWAAGDATQPPKLTREHKTDDASLADDKDDSSFE